MPDNPRPLAEAAINLPDGTGLSDWLHSLAKEAQKTLVAMLPKLEADEMGNHPHRYFSVVETWAEEVWMRVSTHGMDSYESSYYRIPYTSGEDGTIALGEPAKIEIGYKMTATDIAETPPTEPPMTAESVLAALEAQAPDAVMLAEGYLAKHSGHSPLAPAVAVALSKARRRVPARS